MVEIEIWKALLLAAGAVWFAFQLGKQYGIKEETELQHLRRRFREERDPARRHRLHLELDQVLKHQSPRLFRETAS